MRPPPTLPRSTRLAALLFAFAVGARGADAPGPLHQLAAPALQVATDKAVFAPVTHRVWDNIDTELRRNFAPRLDGGEPCTLEIADQFIRR